MDRTLRFADFPGAQRRGTDTPCAHPAGLCSWGRFARLAPSVIDKYLLNYHGQLFVVSSRDQLTRSVLPSFPPGRPESGCRGLGGGCRRVLPRWGPRRNEQKGDGGDFMLVKMSAFVVITVDTVDAEVKMN